MPGVYVCMSTWYVYVCMYSVCVPVCMSTWCVYVCMYSVCVPVCISTWLLMSYVSLCVLCVCACLCACICVQMFIKDLPLLPLECQRPLALAPVGQIPSPLTASPRPKPREQTASSPPSTSCSLLQNSLLFNQPFSLQMFLSPQGAVTFPGQPWDSGAACLCEAYSLQQGG